MARRWPQPELDRAMADAVIAGIADYPHPLFAEALAAIQAQLADIEHHLRPR
jgi:hypothetical protein